jgi:hypothetical protein
VSTETSIEIYGVREALAELGKLDKKYRFAAQNRIKAAAGPMLDEARQTYPDNSTIQDALSGWSRGGRLGYDKSKVDKGVTIKIGGRSYGNAYAVVTLVQNNAGGALFDIAGLRDGSQGVGGTDRLGRSREDVQSDAFLAALNARFGKAQRGLWRKRKRIMELAETELMKALQDIAAEANRKLVA